MRVRIIPTCSAAGLAVRRGPGRRESPETRGRSGLSLPQLHLGLRAPALFAAPHSRVGPSYLSNYFNMLIHHREPRKRSGHQNTHDPYVKYLRFLQLAVYNVLNKKDCSITNQTGGFHESDSTPTCGRRRGHPWSLPNDRAGARRMARRTAQRVVSKSQAPRQ
jgi:hypothetical protein